jgi:hypothetical protein
MNDCESFPSEGEHYTRVLARGRANLKLAFDFVFAALRITIQTLLELAETPRHRHRCPDDILPLALDRLAEFRLGKRRVELQVSGTGS